MIAILASFCSCAAFFQAHEEKSFVSWMRETNQLFTGDEYQTRLGVWLANSRFVQEHNSANSYKVAMNHLSALTPAEYCAMLGVRRNVAAKKTVAGKKANADSLDWREKGAVVAVKDQGQCGSCWAFSTIASAEGANFLSSKKLLSLSESNIVDCVDECYGCNGGLMTAAFDYVIASQAGKFMLETDYPYKAVQGSCKFVASKAVGSVSKYIEIAEGDEDDLAAQCEAHGPVSVAIDASHYSFQLYKSGIYDEKKCSPEDLDHGVTCVGYGAESSTKYWIVKNSWATVWGEKGYIRMIWKNNQCGIASMACVAVA